MCQRFKITMFDSQHIQARQQRQVNDCPLLMMADHLPNNPSFEQKNLLSSEKVDQAGEEAQKINHEHNILSKDSWLDLFECKGRQTYKEQLLDWGVIVGVLGMESKTSLIPRECQRVRVGFGEEVATSNLRAGGLELVVVFKAGGVDSVTLLQLLASGASLLLIIQQGDSLALFLQNLGKYLIKQFYNYPVRQLTHTLCYKTYANQQTQLVQLQPLPPFLFFMQQNKHKLRHLSAVPVKQHTPSKLKSTSYLEDEEERMLELQAEYFGSRAERTIGHKCRQQQLVEEDLQIYNFNQLCGDEEETDCGWQSISRSVLLRRHRSHSADNLVGEVAVELDDQFFNRY